MGRLFCLFGFHHWGTWSPVYIGAMKEPIYKNRQCLSCGLVQTDVFIGKGICDKPILKSVFTKQSKERGK